MTNATRRATITLPADNQILIIREFDAPRELVWRAWTEPELISRWWGGQRGKVTSIENDMRVGGTWRYVMRANEGFEVAFHGECLELDPPNRMVSTEIFEPVPDHPARNTMTLTEHDGRTTLTILVEHDSQQSRDMHINSGMEGGLNESLDLLEQLAQSLGS